MGRGVQAIEPGWLLGVLERSPGSRGQERSTARQGAQGEIRREKGRRVACLGSKVFGW